MELREPTLDVAFQKDKDAEKKRNLVSWFKKLAITIPVLLPLYAYAIGRSWESAYLAQFSISYEQTSISLEHLYFVALMKVVEFSAWSLSFVVYIIWLMVFSVLGIILLGVWRVIGKDLFIWIGGRRQYNPTGFPVELGVKYHFLNLMNELRKPRRSPWLIKRESLMRIKSKSKPYIVKKVIPRIEEFASSFGPVFNRLYWLNNGMLIVLVVFIAFVLSLVVVENQGKKQAISDVEEWKVSDCIDKPTAACGRYVNIFIKGEKIFHSGFHLHTDKRSVIVYGNEKSEIFPIDTVQKVEYPFIKMDWQ